MASSNPVLFKFGTRAEYDAIKANAQDNALYFLTDTGELLRGKRNLAQANYYEVEQGENEAADAAAARITASVPLIKNDVCIVKKRIANDNYSHTAFVYDGAHWRAMDGNYNAENVYFDENIMITTEVGNIKLSNGSAEIPAEGKNLKQVFEALWTKENYNPTVSNPSIELTIDKSTEEGEVGTAYTAPTATVTAKTFGSFQFGSKDSEGTFHTASATSDVVFSTLKVGAAVTAAALTDANSTSIADVSATATTKSVSHTGVGGIYSDTAQVQKFSASATHSGSVRKGVSNLGNFVNTAGNASVQTYDAAGKGIAANAGTMAYNGSKSYTATGYRAWFVGMLDTIPTADQITSAYIRDLTNKGKVSTTTFDIKPGEAGAKCVLVAVPTSAGSLTAAVLTSSMNTDILEDYTKNQKTVQVADASEAVGTEVAYTVYWYKPAALGSDEVHKLTITKK